jgi:predicted Zn-dependent protease
MLLTSSLFVSCGGGATSTLAEFMIPDGDEAKLGAEFHKQLKDSAHIYPIYTPGFDSVKTTFVSYVQGVFDDILAQVPEKERPAYFSDFRLTIIEDDVINAFAVPGGYIYIYTGILKELKNEAELAGILGHEISHVTQHHYRRTVLKGTALTLAAEALAGGEGTLSVFVKQGFGVLGGSYISKDHEYEADQFGTQLIKSAGRNPRGIASFFERQKGWHFDLISTHPAAEKRVKEVDDLIKENNWESFIKDNLNYAERYLKSTALLR